jgi:Na+-translocating ferredoxin:NAD+ oxidoreductase RnfE subunit
VGGTNMNTLLILFFFTIVYECLIVAYTISVADRKKYMAAVFSALIEPIKFVSLLIVMDTPYKVLGIGAISLACAISNIAIIHIMDKISEKKKGKKDVES